MPIVVLLVGVPAYLVAKKHHARSSLDSLLAERFTPRPCMVASLPVSSGGHFECAEAYDDKSGSGLVLVVGSWERGTVKVRGGVTTANKLASGVFKPGADAAWMARVHPLPDVIITAPVDGGAVAVWDELPDRDSVLAHFAAAR